MHATAYPIPIDFNQSQSQLNLQTITRICQKTITRHKPPPPPRMSQPAQRPPPMSNSRRSHRTRWWCHGLHAQHATSQWVKWSRSELPPDWRGKICRRVIRSPETPLGCHREWRPWEDLKYRIIDGTNSLGANKGDEPLASSEFAGVITFSPGTCAYQAAKSWLSVKWGIS